MASSSTSNAAAVNPPTDSAGDGRLARLCRGVIERPGVRQKPFRYTPLNPRQIRILQLYSNTGDDIRGYVVHTNADDPETYVALSYVWAYTAPVEPGTVPPHVEEWLHTPGGRIRITPALSRALTALKRSMANLVNFCYDDGEQHAWFTIPVWCDAICINQADLKEKSVQVRLMTEIYARAKVVFGYLGDGAEGSDLALQVLAEIGNKGVTVRNDNQGWEDLLHSQEVFSHLSDDTPSRRALKALIARPWFRRVWIIQEIVVSRNLVLCCGNLSISWRQFTYGIQVFQEAFQHAVEAGSEQWQPMTVHEGEAIQRDLQSFHENLMLARMLLGARPTYQSGQRFQLYHWIRQGIFRRFGASDARDHLFSLLNLTLDANEPQLIPDYEQSWETIAVRYAFFFHEQGHALDLLLSSSGHPHSNPALPSWCPDWSLAYQPGQTFGAILYSEGDKELYCSGGKHPFTSSINIQTNELKLSGLIVDSLLKTSQTQSGRAEVVRTDTMMGLLEEISKTHLSYPTGESYEEIKWRILVANSDGDGNEAPQEWGQVYKYWMSTRPQRRAKTWDVSQVERQELGRLLTPFLHAAAQNNDCEVFQTMQGYLGLSTGKPQVGDEVCVVPGSPVPILIRVLDQYTSLYKIVGQCYVHGLMKGEALEHPRTIETVHEIRIK